jgi:hypothetical protein
MHALPQIPLPRSELRGLVVEIDLHAGTIFDTLNFAIKAGVWQLPGVWVSGFQVLRDKSNSSVFP